MDILTLIYWIQSMLDKLFKPFKYICQHITSRDFYIATIVLTLIHMLMWLEYVLCL